MQVEAETLDILRERTSAKWRLFPQDVLPLFVAEMDYPLAVPIIRVLQARIAASDSGYVASPLDLGVAFAAFASRHWGWTVDPARVRTTTDVSVCIVETLRRVIRAGEGVVVTSPVYAPFTELVAEAGGRPIDVPLTAACEFDLDGFAAAFEGGARAVLISNPHNPLGHPHSAESLTALADLAAAHRVTVVSDEIHGPLIHAGQTFTPFLSISDAAREWGITVTSASKAFNLAGFKCGLMVAESDRGIAVLDGMWREVPFRTSILGYHASIAAFTECDDWLDGAIAAIDRSANLLTSLLAEYLPEVRYAPPRASYLAWLDFRALGWGDDPAARALEVARVALNSGLGFGPSGTGFARLNLACSPEVLTDAITRLSSAR